MSENWQAAVDAYAIHRSYPAAAKALGLTESAIKNRLYRARQSGITPTPPKVKPRISVGAVIKPAATVANSRVLVISDLHCPYQHRDALAFLQALKDKYNPDRVVNVGDELDYHAMSFHDSDPDLDSAGRELQKGREVLWELAAMFPRMDLVDSNHGSMAYRKGKAHGVPRHLLLEYRDAVFAEKHKDGSIVRPGGRGEGWIWHHSLVLDLPGARKCLIVHGMSKATMQNVKQCGMNFIQGHHHGSFETVFNGTPDALNWGMTVGCLIDDHSMAFAYNKTSMARPVIGCGIILDGMPKLLPMVLAKGGRWNGFVP